MLKRSVVHRRGSSLVDVVAACVLTAMLLVPSMAVMRDSIELHQTLQMRQELLTHCQSLLEKELWELSGGKTPGTHTGQIKIDDTTMAFTVTSSDKTTLGGIPGRLIAVTVSAWDDQNRNRRLDKNEKNVSMYSKIAWP